MMPEMGLKDIETIFTSYATNVIFKGFHQKSIF